jgi:hypothetical protein
MGAEYENMASELLIRPRRADQASEFVPAVTG